tara:strand:+ start:431 stop:1267 length:837 start_codon:yes stop_codon:yes gene_type:complete
MARKTPTPGQKILYLLLVIFGSIIFYFDFNTNSLQSIRNGYTSFKISSLFLIREGAIDPIKNIFNITRSKQKLIDENKNLKEALDISYLNNYLISKENIFYKDKNIIQYPLKKEEDSLTYSVAKIKDINHNVFNCCDHHRMYIEIISSDLSSNLESIVFNNSGIVGHVISDDNYLEVMLLTDIDHSIPIKSESENFFCNARGSGRASIIICSYNPLVWDEEMQLEKEFFTSGLGGIFPKDIVVGNIVNIIDIEPTKKQLEIKLIADPLESDLFGVISN